MSLSDYSHWNEDAQYMWWQEEGRFGSEEPEYDPDDYLPDEPADHDDSGDECIAQGDFSTRKGTYWSCDGCEGMLVFTRNKDGRMTCRHDLEWTNFRQEEVQSVTISQA